MKYSPTYSSIQLKRGTSDRWLATNPILLQGEVGLEVISNTPLPDTYRIKIGDGVNTWQTLPYHIGVDWTEQQVAAEIKLISSNSLSLSQTSPPLMIGADTGQNLAFDNNEIQSRANGVASTLYLQSYGGATSLGASNASNNSNLIVNGSLTMLNGATVNATIDSSGRFSAPLQPSFQAQKTTHTTASAYLVFDNVYHNIGGAYNATNGKFTAPVTGRYLVTFSTLLYSMGSASSVYILINGVQQAFMGTYGQFTGSYAGQGASQVVKLNANDYVQWYFTQNGTNLHSGYTNASAYFLG